MQLWNLSITLITKLTVRHFQEINRLNEKYTNNEIDTTTLSNELFKLVIDNINWEKDKEKIENLILDMDSLEDYSKLNEEVAKIINEATNWLKKKS
jgi:hypothetical protein